MSDRKMSNEILRFIVAYKTTHDGNSPTYREIVEGCGVTSTSMVAYYLDDLEDRGLILRSVQRGRSRLIEVVGGYWVGPEKGI